MADRHLWTIYGVYNDTGVVFECLASTESEDPHAAMAQVALEYCHHDLTIIGALPGKHKIMPPCEDTRKSCSISDLIPDEDEEEKTHA